MKFVKTVNAQWHSTTKSIRSVYSESPDQNPEDLFYVLLAGNVPPKLRAYARYMTSSAMTLWLKNGCDIDDATFAQMLMGICATCTSLCP